jgi:putative CocE/NonD family hydrolase
VAGLLAGIVTATLLSAPAPAATYTTVKKVYIVPTRHAKLHVEVAHPAVDGKVVKAPSVLTYSPYYGTLETRLSDASTWTRDGLARVSADVIGTGNSGGCYDYGGKREKETGYDLVEWIAKQPWSTGKVGMIGGSYDGTTAMATAVMRPPHLTTIVPEAAISRWYDYAYSGGMRYSFNNERMGHENPGLIIDEQGFDTPGLFSLGISIPPPVDYDQPDWQERVQSGITPCDELKHVQNGYSLNPDYDAFWQERDYAKDAGNVTIPVLVALNWGDWNVKQETSIRYWEALRRSPFRRLAIGTRWEGHGTPGGEYSSLRHEWMNHFLRGAKNAVPRTPEVMSQTSDSKGPGPVVAGRVPKTTDVALYAQYADLDGDFTHALLPAKPKKASTGVAYALTGKASESGALAVARTGGEAAWFETPALTRDVRLFGSPKVTVWSTVHRSWVTYAVSVVDIDPAHYGATAGQRHPSETNALLGVTRGWLDSRYRRSLAKREPWKVGANGTTIVAKPQDYTFRKGHAIGLLVTGEHVEWVVPKPYDDPAGGQGGTVTVDTSGRTVVHLPLVGGVDPRKLFAPVKQISSAVG